MTKTTPDTRPRRRLRAIIGATVAAALVGGFTQLATVGAPSLAAPPYPAPVMTGYVPLETDATQKTMENANAAADTTLDFTVGITNAGAGAVMYYDHWEDGFEADLTNPVQSTTEVWGDGDALSGDAETYCGVGCAGDVLPAGAVFVLRNNITTPRDTSIRWDGRDRVSSTRGFAITAGGFSTPLGSVLSASASAYDTTKWGVDYWIPVGEDMSPPSGTSDAFSTTSVQIMADQPGTVVDVDTNGDGSNDQTATLGRGEVMFVDGGVSRGAHVQSSKPVQVHVGAGDAGATYELRWFTLFPTSLLTADYVNPVGSAADNQRTVTYLFNTGTTTISITPACSGCAGTLTIPAKTGASFTSPLSQAVRFESAGGEHFAAVGAAGSESGAAPGSATDNSSSYDWGFGLVPTKLLTPKAVLGWAPGNSTNPPDVAGNRDDDPVWISAMSATNIYIDYDGNPATGALGPDCDGNYDEIRAVGALQSERIFDNTDGDMTGASIYTCDGTKLAGAWGEDAANAPTGSPGFDAGYALIPSTVMLLDKSASLLTDANSDGRFGPGDTITYDISIADAGAISFTNINISDPIPAGTSYVLGSATYDDSVTVVPIADDITPPAATPYPFDESGAALPTINPGVTAHVRYSVQVNNPFASAPASVTNSVIIVADQATGTATNITPLVEADLSLTKAVTTTPTYIGQNATYLLTVANAGPDTATGVAVTDLLPGGLTYVSSTASQGGYVPGTGQWSVGTLANGASATLSITATVNALSTTNSAEITAAAAVDPDSTPNNASTTEDDDATAPLTVLPRADISLTKTRDSGPDLTGDTTFTLTLSNAGPSPSSGVVVTDYAPAGATFVSATPQTSAMADGTFDGGTNVWTVPTLASGAQAQMHVVYNTPVAPGVNYAQVTASSVDDPDSTPDVTALSGSNLPDQDDEASAAIAASGDVRLTNVVSTNPAHVGDVAEFTVTVTNDGPTNTTAVMVTDLLPAGLTFTGATPSTGTYDSMTGVWNVGAMSAGASETLVIAATVADPGSITTTAEVTGSTAVDIDSTPNNHVGTEDDQADAAISTTGSAIGDTVWFDADHDFSIDPHETLLAGVDVTVRWAGPNTTFDDGDDVVTTMTTDAAGSWSASALPFGDYRVNVDTLTLPYGLTTASRDRDGTGSPNTTTFTLTGGQSLTDVDFAYVGSGSIGDTVFRDADNDGVADTGEGIGAAAVTLVWFGPDGVRDPGPSGDDVTSTTATASNGTYHFVNLPSGSFSINVTTASLPAGLTNSVDPDGGNDDGAVLALATGAIRDDVDFGYIGTNSIGDTVFTDVNGDGVQQMGELGLGNVELTLREDRNNDGTYETVIGTVKTAGTGSYLFDMLPAGDYRVDITTPQGLTLSMPGTVTADLVDADVVTDADFGLRPPLAADPGVLGDLVWNDSDADGVVDAGEPGIGGAVITLRLDANSDGTYETTVATQTTTTAGAYGFANLPSGNYAVVATPPGGRAATTPSVLTYGLVAAASINTADFGFVAGAVPPASIGDRVWDDTDADGIQDAGEPGRGGVPLTLRGDLDGDGIYENLLRSTTSSVTGSYTFADLAPGSYRITATPPTGLHATTPVDLDIRVSAGASIDTVDFGVTSGAVPPASVGDRIWLDTNRDGIQGPEEPGMNGVTVELLSDLDHDGSYETVVATMTTAGNGNYLFANRDPGEHMIRITTPDGFATTLPAPRVHLAAGVDDLTADIGLAPPADIPFDLQLTKTLQGTLLNGADATWVLTVTNNGIGVTPATITVTDILPAGLTFRSADGLGWTCAAVSQTVTCTGGGPLDVGKSTTIRIITGVNASVDASIVNLASASATGVELTLANNASQATGIVVDPTVPTTTTTTTTPPPPEPEPSTTTTTPEQPLPSTGTDSESWMSIGGILLCAGIALVAFRRAMAPSPRR